MKENKFYGPKPSYVFLKKELKNENASGFCYHGMNLVYYCIKHDLNGKQVNEYLDKEIQKCKKYLNSHCPCIYHSIPYDIYKDIINTKKEDFKLNVNRCRRYDYSKQKYTDIIDEYYWYDWINKFIRFDSEDNRYKTFFRQCSQHSIALDELFKKKEYCQCEIFLKKMYYKNENTDKVFVVFNRNCYSGNENDFKRTCLNYWYFIKLLDCIAEEDKNDIDIDELYAKKTTPDKINDSTQIRPQVKHTKGFAKPQNKTGVWGLVKRVLTKLYYK